MKFIIEILKPAAVIVITAIVAILKLTPIFIFLISLFLLSVLLTPMDNISKSDIRFFCMLVVGLVVSILVSIY